MFLYYSFIIYQAVTVFRALAAHKRAGKKFVRYYNAADMAVLTADRTVGNFLEQAFPFLVTLWLHGVFCGDVARTACAGWTYVAARALYPFCYGAGQQSDKPIVKPKAPIFLSTLPCYAVIAFFAYELYASL